MKPEKMGFDSELDGILTWIFKLFPREPEAQNEETN